MMIWKKPLDPQRLPVKQLGAAAEKLGIEIVDFGEDFLKAKMPVEGNTQPQGILNGGASCVLAETLGSVASNLCLEKPGAYAVGMGIQAHHFRPASSGFVWAVAKPRHLGRKSHVWDIEIKDDRDKSVCFSVLTMSVIEPD